MHKLKLFGQWGAMVLFLAAPAVHAAGKPERKPLLSLSALDTIRFVASKDFRTTALPLNSPPLDGFVPMVVFGLTNEQNHSDTVEGFGVKSANPGGSTLPIGGPAHYEVATLDSGSQAHIFTYAAAQAFNLAGANLEGTKTQLVQGASGQEQLPISNGLGVYMTDLGNATGFPTGNISVNPGTLKGQWNVPVLTTNPQDQLPNVIGSPILSQYRVSIQNTQPRHITVGTTTYRTPNVSLQDFSTSLPSGYSKLTLKTSDTGPPDSPYYLNFDFTGPTNPDTPAAWSSLVTNGGVAVSRNGQTASDRTFLFDTGAQLSLISNDTAASIGIFNASPANADFTVDVLGVGGVQKVPGYYINTLNLTTQGGVISWSHVPVLVLDVADPRDPSSAMPGILGTNLFGDRDLILNTNIDATGQTYLGIGPQWMWGVNAGGNWSNAANWATGTVPSGMDTQANFFSSITSPQTITVDGAGFTVGTIAFDNAQSYTINGPGRLTLQVSVDQAHINLTSGNHTIAAPMTFASDTTITVLPISSTLTISGDVTSPGITIAKDGLGTVLTKNVRAGSLNVMAGTVKISAKVAANDPGGTSVLNALSISPGAQLDLTNNSMVIHYSAIGTLVNDTRLMLKNGLLTSSLADATHRLGYGDNAVLGKSTFAGQNVGSSDLLVKYTFGGDANLDGQVDVTDLGALATHWQTAAAWTGGDFNYDGFVDVSDLGMLATAWQLGVSNPLGAGSLQAALEALGLGAVSVPEPATTGLIGLGGFILLLVRYNRRHGAGQ